MSKKTLPATAIDFKSLFDHLPDPHLVLSPDLLIIAANNAFLREARLTAEETLNQSIAAAPWLSRQAQEALAQSLEQALAEKQPQTASAMQFNLPVTHAQQEAVKYWSVSSTPIQDEHGNVTYILLKAKEQQQAEHFGEQVFGSRSKLPEEAKGAVWEKNIQTGVLTWSKEYAAHFGYKQLQSSPREWESLVHPDDLSKVTQSIHKAIEEGKEEWEYTYRFCCADGTYKNILDRGYIIKNGNGQPERVVGAMLDITEKLLIEQQLKEQMAHTLQILESLPLMIWTATPDGNTNYCNQRWIDYTGAGYESMAGLGWQQFVHPDDLKASIDTWQSSIANGKPIVIQNRWKSAQDGSYRWFLGRAVPVRNNKGEIILWIGSNTDIDDQKKSQEQLERSEKQFRFLAESIPQMVWSANPDGYIDYTNHKWFEYTKMDESSLGFGWAPAIHPDELDSLMSTWLNCVATGEKLEFKVRFQDTEAKTYRWFLLRAEPMRNEEGQIVKWFGTATDIHDQMLLQEQLQKSEKQFRFLAESIPQMVWTTRPDGYHDYFNQRWMDYTGLTLEESMGMVWNDMVHPEDRERSWNRWQHSLRTGDFYEVEYRFKSGFSGSYRWFLGQAMPMRDEQGNIVKWFGTCTDIEDHKKAEEQLMEKNLELERSNQDLDSFVYSASHDLKLPILNMAGIFDELVRVAEFKDPDADKMIGMFTKSLEQIQTTIDELSDVVRVQKAGRREAERLPLQEVMQDVLVSLQHPIEDSGAVITTDYSQAPELCFTRSGLKSILYNLISNSIKYKAPDRTPVIHLCTKIKDNFVELSVTDNGIGLDTEKHQGKLFQMFKRFHNHVNGSGLGLYIVNRLLTNHGGYINIESKLNKGTTFFLYFKTKEPKPHAVAK